MVARERRMKQYPHACPPPRAQPANRSLLYSQYKRKSTTASLKHVCSICRPPVHVVTDQQPTSCPFSFRELALVFVASRCVAAFGILLLVGQR